MLIDWFTVGAQALNFVVLVWLMKRFLYKPILAAIDAREKSVAAELKDADSKKSEAQKERDEFQKKNDDFDRQRAELLSQATEAAKSERQRLITDARKAADALSVKRQEALGGEAKSLGQAIRQHAQQEVFAIARKTLTDLADSRLEQRIVEVLTHRLRAMDGAAKSAFGAALTNSADGTVVRSAFELAPEQRAAIQTAINETFAADIRLRFETAPQLIGGIELAGNGQKLAWSIGDYLANLQKSVDVLLKQPAAEPAPVAA